MLTRLNKLFCQVFYGYDVLKFMDQSVLSVSLSQNWTQKSSGIIASLPDPGKESHTVCILMEEGHAELSS